MRIYVAHSRAFDFKGELYSPLKLALGQERKCQLILPHAESSGPFPSRQLFEQRKCDIVLAEVSWPSTGLGIELGWASSMNIPIYAISRTDVDISGSIAAVSVSLVTYQDSRDLAEKINQLLDGITKSMNEISIA